MDLQKLAQAFAIISSGVNKEMMAQANRFLMESQTTFGFYQALMSIYQNSKDSTIRLQSLIFLSNVIKRNWMSREKAKKKQSQSEKQLVKRNLILLMNRVDSPYSKFVEQSILAICKYQFPVHCKQICQVIINRLENLSIQTWGGHTLRFLRLLQKIAKNHYCKRSGWEQVIQIVNALSKYFKVDAPPSQQSRRVSKCLLYLLFSLQKNKQGLPQTAFIFQRFQQRAQFLMSLKQQSCNKQLKSLIYASSYLALYYPIGYTNILERQFYLYQQALNSSNQKVIKSGLIGYIKSLSNYFFFSNQIKQKNCLKIDQASLQLQKKAHLIFRTYFEAKIQGLIVKIIGTVMRPASLQEEVGAQIVDFAHQGFDEEIQNSIHNLCMLFLKQSISKFQQQSGECLRKMLQQINNCPLLIQLNLLAFCSLFNGSRILQPIGMQLMRFVFSKRQLYRRIPALLSCTHSLFNQQSLVEILRALFQILKLKDRNLIYQGSQVISNIINKRSSLPIQNFLHEISHQMIYLILQILPSINSTDPHMLWPIVNQLSQLIEMHACNQQFINKVFNQPNFVGLYQLESLLIEQALVYLFNSILQKQSSLSLQMNCLKYIEKQLEKRSSNIKLWYYILRDSNNLATLKNVILSLFNKHFQTACIKAPNSSLIFVLQQMVLSRLIDIPFYQIKSFALKMLEMSNSQEEDVQADLKSSILSVMVTMLIIYKPKCCQYEQLIKLGICQILSPQEQQNKYWLKFKTSSLVLISRAILIDIQGFFSLIPLENKAMFFNAWILGIKSLSSKLPIRINLVALLHCFALLPVEVFVVHQQFLTQFFSNEIQNNLNKPPRQIGLDNFQNKMSNRKIQIRKSSSFQQIDLNKEVQLKLSQYLKLGLSLKQSVIQTIRQLLHA